MRSTGRYVCVAALSLVPAMLCAQWQKPEWFAPDLRSPQFLAEEIRDELAKANLLAQREIRTGENIFVERGSVREEAFPRTPRKRAIAVSAGQRAKVAKVVLTERSIQVLFHEKCGVIILWDGEEDLRDMNIPELVAIARSGLSLVFHIAGEQKRKLPT